MTSLLHSRRARWAVPLAVAAVVGGVGVAVPMTAGADPGLPKRSAADLLASVGKATDRPFAGTVVETARLGLPALPQGDGASTSLTSLVSGSHTAKVWYGGPQRMRVALTTNLAETDVIRNGRDAWTWTSSTNTAQHATLPAGSEAPARMRAATVTPAEAATRALAAVDPTTQVVVDGTVKVAGRSAYELVLKPRDARSLVGSVRLAVDAKTSLPLRVRVFATSSPNEPAFETGFQSVTFGQPKAAVFRFSPPPGATVKRLAVPSGAAHAGAIKKAEAADAAKRKAAAQGRGGAGGPTVVGRGWTSVVVVRGAAAGADSAAKGSSSLGAVLGGAKRVSGSYGSGRLLTTKLLTVLLLDDGRVLAGSVQPSVLEQAAADPKAAVTAPRR